VDFIDVLNKALLIYRFPPSFSIFCSNFQFLAPFLSPFPIIYILYIRHGIGNTYDNYPDGARRQLSTSRVAQGPIITKLKNKSNFKIGVAAKVRGVVQRKNC
jgi:hypothetical protein